MGTGGGIASERNFPIVPGPRLPRAPGLTEDDEGTTLALLSKIYRYYYNLRIYDDSLTDTCWLGGLIIDYDEEPNERRMMTH